MRLIRHLENRSALWPAILCASVIGFLLFWGRIGEGISFDALVLFRSGPIPTEAVIVTMDDLAYGDKKLNKGYAYPNFNRETHGKFLNKLKEDGAKLVVFDLFFKESQPEDPKLAAAIINHGNVVIVSEIAPFGQRFPGGATIDPVKPFDNLPGCTIALPLAHQDVTRTFQPDAQFRPSLARAAAEKWGVSVDALPKSERWVKYYGDRDGLPTEPYQHAMEHASNYFKGKAVFIGAKPNIKLVSEPTDEFGTPWTRWSGHKMRGVEIQATMFLNLIHNDWLTRMSMRDEIILILLVGIIFGWVFTLFRPVPGLVLVPVGVALVSIGAVALLWIERIWFNWLVIGWIEIPLAWATSAVIYSRVLFREKESLRQEKDSLQKEKISLQHKLDSIASQQNAPNAAPRPEVSAAQVIADIQPITIIDGEKVVIRDFELLSAIGTGAYGQVWLARNLVGTYRAIKIVFRKRLPEQRAFEREFEGVQHFERISRGHPGWVPILHIGKDDAGGFFYYVMDAADDIASENINPATYLPKTLGRVLVNDHYLSVGECIDLGIHLADALACLHRQGYVHRDIKPANIIFANGKPRLADIGLVARAGEQRTIVGTPGFMATEGIGTARADIFSLGRVLYMASTGCPPDHHPSLPTSLGKRDDARELMQLMQIINKACAPVNERYESAEHLHTALVNLQAVFEEAHA